MTAYFRSAVYLPPSLIPYCPPTQDETYCIQYKNNLGLPTLTHIHFDTLSLTLIQEQFKTLLFFVFMNLYEEIRVNTLPYFSLCKHCNYVHEPRYDCLSVYNCVIVDCDHLILNPCFQDKERNTVCHCSKESLNSLWLRWK